jgi:antitoxin component YwqK of YwqJK toxin-antitoxin module
MATFLIFFIFLASCEPSRLEVVEVWDNGAPSEAWRVSPDGEAETWFSWYRNGIKAEEMSFAGGMPNGDYRKWSPTGFIIETGIYKDSLREGKWTFFAKEKLPYMQGYYKKGLKDGKWLLFDEKKKIAGEQFYRNDSAIGLWKKFQNGKLKEEDSCFESNEAGFFRAYSEEGKISFYQECRHGKLNGISMEYYPGGSLQKIGHFENGLKNGLWVEYFASGNLRKVENWTHYLRNGEWIKFDESGNMLSKTEFIDGSGVFEDTSWRDNRIDGEIRIKLREGEYSRVELWDYGEKISTTDYHKDSPKPIALGFWKNKQKDGAWRTWYRSGTLRDSMNFKDGRPVGAHFHYDSAGRLYKKEIVQENGGKIIEMLR